MFPKSIVKPAFARAAAYSVRTYATTAPKVTVPITLHGIEGRYATALFSAAAKQNALDQVEFDLTKIRSAIDKDANLAEFIGNPTISKQLKTKNVNKLLGSKGYNQLTLNFFALLAENGRLDVTPKIGNAFGQLMAAHRGELQVNVVTAKALDAPTTKKIKDMLTSQGGSIAGQTYKTLSISNKVNPAILGGMIIEIGDKTIDMSVINKVTKLNKALTDAI
ncbi:F1 complex, OSCP/delta subunit of ATPase [Ramicandelaber brevisporus]|nr:F1 complex, OSCP/delta subunit of ATPase [Ramicandelaber brevisporus]